MFFCPSSVGSDLSLCFLWERGGVSVQWRAAPTAFHVCFNVLLYIPVHASSTLHWSKIELKAWKNGCERKWSSLNPSMTFVGRAALWRLSVTLLNPGGRFLNKTQENVFSPGKVSILCHETDSFPILKRNLAFENKNKCLNLFPLFEEQGSDINKVTVNETLYD